MPYPNPYFPAGYLPYQQAMQYQMYQQPQNTVQDSLIQVQSEEQARQWDVMPGQSRTFINVNAPYCYTKSMPASQFEPMIFKRFRLVEEPDSIQNAQEQSPQSEGIDLSGYVLKAEFEPFCALIDGIKQELQTIRKDLYDDEQSADT